jgi:iron complex outermembrane receptor protein
MALAAVVMCPAQTALPPHPVETVIVTGVYEPVPLEETDRSVTVLSAPKEHDVLFHDATGILRLDASVDVQARGPNNIQTDVSIRGGLFGQTLVLWNGLRLNDAQTGHHDLDTPIPLEAVDRVEILKGAGSTLYGSDAVGGVINFISQPPETSEVRLRTSVGNFGVNQQHVELATVRNAWTEELTADRDFSSGFRFDRDYRNLSISSLTHHAGGPGATEIMLAIGDRPFGADQFYGNYPSWERTRSWFAGIRQTLGASTEIDFAYRRHTDLFVLYRDQPQVYANRHALETYQGALRRRWRLGWNTQVHYGADGSYDSIQSSNLGAHTRGRAAAFGAIDFRALGRFSLNIGAREEVYRGLRHQFSPSVTGGVWASSKLRFRGGVSHAFRLPTFTELYYHDPATIGLPSLKPEQAWSGEAAAEWRPAGRILAQATLFQRRERNDIDYVRESAAEPWRAANFGRVRATGVETGLHVPVRESGELTLSYTAMRLRTDSTPGLLSRYTSNYPVHNGTLNYQGVFARLLLLRTRLGVLERTGRDAYPLWEVAVARASGRIRPYIQFANLTNAVYQEIPGVPMPGRTVVGGIEIRAKLK